MTEPVVRPPTDDEFEAWYRATASGYFAPTPTDVQAARWRPALQSHRLRLVELDGATVGTIAGFASELVVMGETVAAAALGLGSVRTDVGGRGVFRELMAAMAADARDADEPVELLYTSHGGIHQRFGFGKAVGCRDLEIASADLASVGGDLRRVRLVERDEAMRVLPDVHRRVVESRTAGLLRPEAMWRGWLDRDPVAEQGGGWSEHRIAVADGDDGYVVYRVRPDDGARRPAGDVAVVELVGATPQATADLWRHVAAIDLATTVRARFRPVDDPLRHLLADEFTLRETAGEPMWLKLRDLGAAWAARGWAGEGEVVVRVHDRVEPANDGTWLLGACPKGGSAERTSADPALELDAWHLATAWLGGVRTTSLRDAGLVTEHVAGAAATLDRMLAGPTAPWVTFQF